jgi:hypothetical protein
MVKRSTGSKDVKPKIRKGSPRRVSPKPEPPIVRVEERHQWISEAAYYRAEGRGFFPGRELDDWLAAEAEIDGRFGKIRKSKSRKDL